MADPGFFRFDRLPPRVANGYVRTADGGWRTNAGSLPIIGEPHGGMFATAGDIDMVVSNDSTGAWPMIRTIDDWIRTSFRTRSAAREPGLR